MYHFFAWSSSSLLQVRAGLWCSSLNILIWSRLNLWNSPRLWGYILSWVKIQKHKSSITNTHYQNFLIFNVSICSPLPFNFSSCFKGERFLQRYTDHDTLIVVHFPSIWPGITGRQLGCSITSGALFSRHSVLLLRTEFDWKRRKHGKAFTVYKRKL